MVSGHCGKCDSRSRHGLKSDTTHSIMVIWVKIFKTEKKLEIHLVRLTEVCDKVLRIDYGDDSVIS